MASSNPLTVRKKWRRWLKRLSVELHDLVLTREIYRGYLEILKANPAIQSPGEFHNWVVRNYGRVIAVRVRALIGPPKDPRDLSLSRFLQDLQDNVTAINRAGFVRAYVDKEFAHHDFDNLVGRRLSHPRVSSIKRDARRLLKAEERVRDVVNKQIAHVDIKNSSRKALKFAEIDAAIDLMVEVYKKYNLLITARELALERITWAFDWAAVFDSAWRAEQRH